MNEWRGNQSTIQAKSERTAGRQASEHIEHWREVKNRKEEQDREKR
jgi:hypothetical protein